MKRTDVLKKLMEAGFTFEEGANHTKAYDGRGTYTTAIPRHREISPQTVANIEKQTGVRLR